MESVPSTQASYREEWSVVVGKEVFVLDERQVELLKQATLNGERGLVWFADFAISIPHIQAIYLTRRELQGALPASSEVPFEVSEEQLERNRKRLAEIKAGLFKSKDE